MSCRKVPDGRRQQSGRERQSVNRDDKMTEPGAARSPDGRPDETGTREVTLQGLVLRLAIRLGAIVLLLVWCFTIIRPCLAPVVWDARLDLGKSGR